MNHALRPRLLPVTPLLVAALIAATVTPAGPAALAEGKHPRDAVGVFYGNHDAKVYGAWERWLENDIAVVCTFLHKYDPKNLKTNANRMNVWVNTPYHQKIEFGVPLSGNFKAQDDDYWKATAQQLVDRGYKTVYLRLGWEFNGDWYPWGAQGRWADFAAYWRRIVTAIRSVPGTEDYKFVWNFVYGAPIPLEAYPGDDYVDVVSIDLYDVDWRSYPAYRKADPDRQLAIKKNAWERKLQSLDQWARFCRDRGKTIAFSEWAAGYRNDHIAAQDNPVFIQWFYDWMVENQDILAYHCYFNSVDGGSHIWKVFRDTPFPKMKQHFYALFNKSDKPHYEKQFFELETIEPSLEGAKGGVVRDHFAGRASHFMFNGDSVGDAITFVLPDVQPGTYQMEVRYKAFTSRGTAAVSVDGKPLGTLNQHHWSGQFFTKPVSDRTFTVDSARDVEVRFEITGRHAQASSYKLSLDRIDLFRQGDVYVAEGRFPHYPAVIKGTNVAEGKPVSVSSVGAESTPAANAVDGNHWHADSRWMSTDAPWPHWIEIDLGQPTPVSAVRFYAGWKEYDSGFGYKVQRWSGSEWLDIAEDDANRDPVMQQVFDTPVTTDKIRILGTSGKDNRMRLFEVMVFTPDAPGD